MNCFHQISWQRPAVNNACRHMLIQFITRKCSAVIVLFASALIPVTPHWMFSPHARPVSCIHSQKWSPITSCGGPDLALNIVPKRRRSSHLIWELMQSLIQYLPQVISLHSKNVSQLHLPSVWPPSRWANTTFHPKRPDWSRWRAAVMGAVGNGPIRTHLILMQSFNLSGPLGLWQRFILSEWLWFDVLTWFEGSRSDWFPDAQRWTFGTDSAHLASLARFRREQLYLLMWYITDALVRTNSLASHGLVVFRSCGEAETGLF